MTFEEMQTKFSVPEQENYSWFYVGSAEALSKADVSLKLSTIEGLEESFVHKDRSMYFIGLDLGTAMPEGLFDYVTEIDPPAAAEEPVEEGV